MKTGDLNVSDEAPDFIIDKTSNEMGGNPEQINEGEILHLTQA